MSWPDGERYLCPLLLSMLFFFWTGGVLSYLNSSTHMFPRFPPRNSCSFAVFSLVFAATDGHSLLLSSYLTRIGKIENPSYTSHHILHCPATDSYRRSLFVDSLVQALGGCMASWSSAQGCGSGSRSAKILPLPHRREEWRKKRNCFCYPLKSE